MKFGIVGCGVISERMAQAMNLSEEAELYAVAARSADRAQDFAQRYGAQKAYGDYLSLIQDAQVEAVYIGLVHTEHFKVAKLCVENHKAVLCEKPFFISSQEAQTLFALAQKEKVLVMEAMWTRTMPAVRKAIQWVREGRIGKLRLMRGDFAYPFVYNEQTKNHRLWSKDTAGGALWDIGVYPYMYFTAIAGEHPSRVTGNLFWEHGVDASCAFSLAFPCGALADGRASLVTLSDSTARISGTDGYIVQEDFWHACQCTLYNNAGEVVDRFCEPFGEGFVYELAHFAQLYHSGALDSPLIPHADTLDFVKSAESLLRQCPQPPASV